MRAPGIEPARRMTSKPSVAPTCTVIARSWVSWNEAGEVGWEAVRSGESGSSGRQVGDNCSLGSGRPGGRRRFLDPICVPATLVMVNRCQSSVCATCLVSFVLLASACGATGSNSRRRLRTPFAHPLLPAENRPADQAGSGSTTCRFRCRSAARKPAKACAISSLQTAGSEWLVAQNSRQKTDGRVLALQ